MKLDEWTKQHIRFQDCMKKDILSIQATQQGFLVKEKERTIEYLVDEKLSKLPQTTDADKLFIVTLNTKENVLALLDVWKQVSKDQKLTVLFVNPDENQRWHVQPYIHDKISEHTKKSLFALHEGITPL